VAAGAASRSFNRSLHGMHNAPAPCEPSRNAPRESAHHRCAERQRHSGRSRNANRMEAGASIRSLKFGTIQPALSLHPPPLPKTRGFCFDHFDSLGLATIQPAASLHPPPSPKTCGFWFDRFDSLGLATIHPAPSLHRRPSAFLPLRRIRAKAARLAKRRSRSAHLIPVFLRVLCALGASVLFRQPARGARAPSAPSPRTVRFLADEDEGRDDFRLPSATQFLAPLLNHPQSFGGPGGKFWEVGGEISSVQPGRFHFQIASFSASVQRFMYGNRIPKIRRFAIRRNAPE